VPSYEIDKGVDNLQAPASYQLRVGFRWYNARGKVVRTAHRLTKICHEPDLRPNLAIGRVTVTPAPHRGEMALHRDRPQQRRRRAGPST